MTETNADVLFMDMRNAERPTALQDAIMGEIRKLEGMANLLYRRRKSLEDQLDFHEEGAKPMIINRIDMVDFDLEDLNDRIRNLNDELIGNHND